MSQYEFETEKWVENSVKCRFKVVKEANLEFCQIKLGFFSFLIFSQVCKIFCRIIDDKKFFLSMQFYVTKLEIDNEQTNEMKSVFERFSIAIYSKWKSFDYRGTFLNSPCKQTKIG